MKQRISAMDWIGKVIGKNKEDYVNMQGWAHWVRRNSQGDITGEWDVNNLITNSAKAKIADLLVGDVGSAAPTQWDDIAIGTGTGQTATSTTLATEISTNGGARAGSTGTRVTTSVTNDTAQFVLTYSFTGSFAVTESGVFDDISTGTMLCYQSFSAINVVSGDSLQVTWKVQIS